MPGEEATTQKKVYQYIQKQDTKNKSLGQTMIIGKDWNATLFPKRQVHYANQQYHGYPAPANVPQH